MTKQTDEVHLHEHHHHHHHHSHTSIVVPPASEPIAAPTKVSTCGSCGCLLIAVLIGGLWWGVQQSRNDAEPEPAAVDGPPVAHQPIVPEPEPVAVPGPAPREPVTILTLDAQWGQQGEVFNKGERFELLERGELYHRVRGLEGSRKGKEYQVIQGAFSKTESKEVLPPD